METPDEKPPEAAGERSADVLRRIRRIGAGAYVVFAPIVLISSGFRGFVGLTCSAAVTMISFLWLEEIIESLLQPSPQLHARRLVLRTVARLAFLAAALSVTIFVVRFDAVSVLLGFSIVVVGIIGEALYETVRSLSG